MAKYNSRPKRINAQHFSKRYRKSAMLPYHPATSIPRTPTLLKKIVYADFKLHLLTDIFTAEESTTLSFNWSRFDYGGL